MKRCKSQISRLAALTPVLSRQARDERGQVFVEFLVILPLFFALVFGVIEFGKGYAYWVDMTHLAGEGGRYASVSWFPGCNPTSTGACAAPTDTLPAYLRNRTDIKELATGDPANPNAEVPNQLDVSYCYPVQNVGLVPGDAGYVKPGDPGSALEIKVKSTFRLQIVNAALSVFDAGFVKRLSDIHLGAQSTVRLERPVDYTRLGIGSINAC